MANNLIQIKRSTVSANPGTSLSNGELAYSYVSNSLFIGSPNGPGAGASAVLIGGSKYKFLDSTSEGILSANASIVTDANSFVNNLYSVGLFISPTTNSPVANSTVAYITKISPESTSSRLGSTFVGSNTELVTSWAVKNYVDQQISQTGAFSPTTPYTWTSVQTHLANVSISDDSATSRFSYLTIGTASDKLTANNTEIFITNLISNTLLNLSSLSISNSQGFSISANLNNLSFFAGNNTFNGYLSYTGLGLVEPGSIATMSPSLLTISRISVGGQFTVNNSVVNFGSIGNVYATSANASFQNITITGNLTISGTATAIDTQNLSVRDNIVYLSTNNTISDSVDIGIVGLANAGSAGINTYYGFARIASANVIQFFATNTAPTSTITNQTIMPIRAFLQPYGTSGTPAFIVNSSAVSAIANNTVSVNFVANTIVLRTALSIASGGTGQDSYSAGDILYASTPSVLSKLNAGANGQILQIVNNLPAYGIIDGGTY